MGFVSRFERLLIAADESRNGRFSSRLAGFIAGQRGMPITVLQLKEGKRTDDGEKLREAAIEGAKEARHARGGGEGREEHPEKVSIGVSKPQAKPGGGGDRRGGGRRGYDVLFVGCREDAQRRRHLLLQCRFTRRPGFDGPLVLTIAGRSSADAGLNILVPVAGTEASPPRRRAGFCPDAAGEVPGHRAPCGAARRRLAQAARRVASDRSIGRRRRCWTTLPSSPGAMVTRISRPPCTPHLATDVAILEEAHRPQRRSHRHRRQPACRRLPLPRRDRHLGAAGVEGRDRPGSDVAGCGSAGFAYVRPSRRALRALLRMRRLFFVPSSICLILRSTRQRASRRTHAASAATVYASRSCLPRLRRDFRRRVGGDVAGVRLRPPTRP